MRPIRPIPRTAPIHRPRDWKLRVSRPESPADLKALRHSIFRGTPYGVPTWTARIADRLGLQSILNPRGLPRKEPKEPRQ